MKKQLFILATSMIMLASCNGGNPAPSPVVTESSTATTTQESKPAQDSSAKEESQVSKASDPDEPIVVSSEAEPQVSKASDPDESIVVSSEAEPQVSEDSEPEQTIISEKENESSAEIFENTIGNWTITSEDVATPPASGYPDPYEKEIASSTGVSFDLYFINVQRGKGKFPSNIQMRKLDGAIYSKSPMKGTLAFELYYNYVEYTSSDMTGYPVIKVASTYEGIDDAAGIDDYERDVESNVVSFSVDIDGFFGIIANEEYASYFKSISFKASE